MHDFLLFFSRTWSTICLDILHLDVEKDLLELTLIHDSVLAMSEACVQLVTCEVKTRPVQVTTFYDQQIFQDLEIFSKIPKMKKYNFSKKSKNSLL